MSANENFEGIGMDKEDIILILKYILNKTVLENICLNTKNYKSVFPYLPQLINFIKSYSPKTYMGGSNDAKIDKFERKLENIFGRKKNDDIVVSSIKFIKVPLGKDSLLLEKFLFTTN